MTTEYSVMIPGELHEQMQAEARRAGLSMDEWLRRAIEARLDSSRQATDPLTRLSALSAPTGDLPDMLSEIREGRAHN